MTVKMSDLSQRQNHALAAFHKTNLDLKARADCYKVCLDEGIEMRRLVGRAEDFKLRAVFTGKLAVPLRSDSLRVMMAPQAAIEALMSLSRLQQEEL